MLSRLSPDRRRVATPRGLVIVGFLLALVTACTRQYVVTGTGPQAYYQTGFPIRDTSGEIARIADTIHRIGVTAYYTTYAFAREDSVTELTARDPATLARARSRYTFDHSKAGTATILDVNSLGVTLITNHHVTRTPDTIIAHFVERAEDARREDRVRLVESVSVRTLQRNVLLGLEGVLAFHVIAQDSAADLALIRVNLPGADRQPGIRALRAPMGDASRLTWGSFVYVIGYPRGHRMVTRGIVSDPGYAADDAFLLDGLFNRGISGGLILAVRGDTGTLEWVGLATGAAGHTEYRLMPENRDIAEEGLLLPYDGPLFMEVASRIEYGVTFPVTTTAIRRFLQEARFSRTARE